jgi:AraC-like DNA-binding protein
MVRLDEGGRAAGEVQLHPPPPSLRDWVQHASVQPGVAARRAWRVVPDTSPHLIFSMTAGAARCRLVGARSTYADIDVDGRVVTVAVRLQPGTLPALTGVPASELTDRAVCVVDAFGADGRRILDALPDVSALAAVERLLTFVAGRVRHRDAPHLVRALSRASRVEDLQRVLGSRARALHTRLIADVGLAPKRALRIERLHAALHRTGRGEPLAAAALDAGYSDQAHLTREARSLLGETPAVWRRRRLCAAESFKNSPRSSG